MSELMKNPRVLHKVQSEVREAYKGQSKLTEDDLVRVRLGYLRLVIKEALRLRMAIPLLVPHMNIRDAELGGHGVPAGTRVLVNAWHLANDPGRWERPGEFQIGRASCRERV